VAQRTSPDDDYAQTQAKPQTASPAAATSSRQDWGKGIKDTIAGGPPAIIARAVKSIGESPLGYTPIGMAAKGIGAAYDALSSTKPVSDTEAARFNTAATPGTDPLTGKPLAAKGSQTATPAPGEYVGMEESRDSLARMRELAGMKK
jgi:hypothetical protein